MMNLFMINHKSYFLIHHFGIEIQPLYYSYEKLDIQVFKIYGLFQFEILKMYYFYSMKRNYDQQFNMNLPSYLLCYVFFNLIYDYYYFVVYLDFPLTRHLIILIFIVQIMILLNDLSFQSSILVYLSTFSLLRVSKNLL